MAASQAETKAMPQPLDRATVDSIGEWMADAMHTNPGHVYICPDERRRHSQLTWLLGRNLMAHPLDASFSKVENGALVAFGFWTSSDDPKITVLDRLRVGYAKLPWVMGIAGMRRLLEVTNTIDALRDEAAVGRSWLYLNSVFVRPDYRGIRVGTDMLAQEIAAVGLSHPDSLLVACTQRKGVLRLCLSEKLGFEVVQETTIGRGPNAFRNWTLTREASA